MLSTALALFNADLERHARQVESIERKEALHVYHHHCHPLLAPTAKRFRCSINTCKLTSSV